jgi:hypothetical protein
MDPDATLAQIREAIQRGNAARDFTEAAALEYGRAAELFGALDEWLKRGGFKPRDWLQGA